MKVKRKKRLSNKFHLVLSTTKQKLKEQVVTWCRLTSSISHWDFYSLFKFFLSEQVYNSLSQKQQRKSSLNQKRHLKSRAINTVLSAHTNLPF